MIKFLILFFTCIYFSEGKNCPELTKAHLTRCDMYYKCVILPSSNHVWIPTTCNKGLIYEHSLRICVLPGDDWECTLGDTPTSTTTTTTSNNSGNHIDDNNNVYGINNLEYLTHQIESYRPATQHYIGSDEFDKTTSSANSDNSYIEIGGSQEDDDQNKIELNETYEVLPYYNISHDDYHDNNNNNINNNNSDDDIEYSGDGSLDTAITFTDSTNNHHSLLNDNDNKEDKEGYIAIPLNSDPNASVASHLQRLTQLIDSLQKSPSSDYYKNNYTTQPLIKMHQNELNANDLNTILAHHNIQSDYEYQQQQQQLNNNNNKYSTKNIYQMSDDGKINPDLLSAILDLQTKLQDTRNTLESHQITTTVKPAYQEQSTTTTSSSPFYYQSYSKYHGIPSNNNNNNNNNNGNDNRPEATKIRLQSTNPFKDSIQNKKQSELGYSTSQIVVNRPEGSVVFALPGGTQESSPPFNSNINHQQSSSSSSSSSSSHDDYKNEPYITQDTLKTILELSKQMVNPQPTQQQPYVPEQNFLQPIFRPIYYNIPIHDLPIPIINNYEKSTKENESNHSNDDQITADDTDNVISQQKYPSHNNKFEQNENNNQDISKYNIRNNIEKRLPNGQSTIIHNNIPITIEGPRPPNNKQINKINGINKESTQPTFSDNTSNDPNTNNNNNNIKFDSYGVKITPYSQNYNNAANIYPEYPPLQLRQSEQLNNLRQNVPTAITNEYGQLTNYYTNQQQQQQAQQQQQDQQQQNQLPIYNRYNQSPASGQIPSNIIDNQYIQISPPQYYRQDQSYAQSPPVAYSPNYPVYYTPSPHLNDKNVNNYINFNTKLYPTIRPSSLSSSQISAPQPYAYQNQISSPITTTATTSQQQQQYLTSNNQQKPQVIDINGSINTNTNNLNNNNNNNNNYNFEQLENTDNFQDEINDDAVEDDDDDDNNNEDVDIDDDITDNEEIQSDAFMQEKIDDSSISGNSNNILGDINGLNVIDLLTNLKEKQQLNNFIQSTSGVQITNPNNKNIRTSDDMFLNSNDSNNKKKIVNVGGQFISYDAFKNSIYPLLQNEGMQSQSSQFAGSTATTSGGTNALTYGIEVLTCTTGVRQPNQTDCTKYFVCNANTGHVVMYSCPQFTAFNSQTHLCEAKHYAECNPMAIRSQITIDHNKNIQYEAQQALQEANRIKAEALRTKQLATLIKLETQNLLLNTSPIQHRKPIFVTQQSQQQNVNHQKQKPTKLIRIGSSSGNTINTNKKRPIIRNRKRLIPCRAPGKIKDTLSKYNYFVCFKGTDGKLRARKMICPNRLTFCPSSRLCTPINGCS